MDRFDYKVADAETYISSGKTPGDTKKSVAWGSTSAFSSPRVLSTGLGLTQLILEPVLDDHTVLLAGVVPVRYLYNGVYLVNNSVRVVANTGPVTFKIMLTATEVSISIDGVDVTASSTNTEDSEIIIAPAGGMLYDKVLHGLEMPQDALVNKRIRVSIQDEGTLSPISYDKLYDPALVLAEDMDQIEGYYVACRKLTEANTTVVFYSDISEVEKSIDGIDWTPVNSIEYHGEDPLIFRSKDPNFSLRFYDTTIENFTIRGGETEVNGEIYKIGNDIGTIFSHDSYLVKGGSLRVIREGMTSVSIMGYLPDSLVEELEPQIDYGGTNYGKMHLYTIDSEDSIELIADEIYISAIGINLNHNDVLDHLAGVSQVSYADEIQPIEIGTAVNSEEEYAILDLQWGM